MHGISVDVRGNTTVQKRHRVEKFVSQRVDFGREDEIAFGQAVDLMGMDGDGHAPPGQFDIGMMALFLGQRADLVDERQRLDEIFELPDAAEMMFFDNVPAGCVFRQRL